MLLSFQRLDLQRSIVPSIISVVIIISSLAVELALILRRCKLLLKLYLELRFEIVERTEFEFHLLDFCYKLLLLALISHPLSGATKNTLQVRVKWKIKLAFSE